CVRDPWGRGLDSW
nr:immunoglobulin heavy chain junction region [Macaca mulatta]MOV39146.1 immunoglobulin heavy chain junction region [Macaca mulatta]MOV39316.1 immunoglobulin heavy chain junction region [Macaca mulatta]MOV40134.1 immunoglobulin heavy chain junction region [Macaca mulatta]MOV42049.1 immunoglobulin heavy chain junction region [Macaca mulatta]